MRPSSTPIINQACVCVCGGCAVGGGCGGLLVLRPEPGWKGCVRCGVERRGGCVCVAGVVLYGWLVLVCGVVCVCERECVCM